ncbi:hypothetical protein Tco_0675201 [Tanacetum coccineum]
MTESPLVDSSFVVPFQGDKVKVILVLVIRVMLLVLGETIQVDMQGLLNATIVKVMDIWLSDQGMQHDSGKCFTPQQELSAEQDFLLRISNPTIESSNKPHVIVEVPSELPKVSLVNASFKKLKFHLAQFNSVVKKRTTLDACTEELLLENDRLLQQIMSQDVLVTMMNSMSLNGESLNMERKRNESCD